MPTYEFDCSDHGTFELARPIARMREPADCPTCGVSARRILSLPNVALVSSVNRKATEVNERSRHEPRLVTRKKTPASDAPPRLHSSHCSRPWALEHS
jgi:putative FmdB family regulatory protein